jgi:hypothetical protein
VAEELVMVSRVPFHETVGAGLGQKYADVPCRPVPWMVRRVAGLLTVIGFGVMEEIVSAVGAVEAPVTENAGWVWPEPRLAQVAPSLTLYKPPPRPRLLVYQAAEVVCAYGSTTTQYVVPAWSATCCVSTTVVGVMIPP